MNTERILAELGRLDEIIRLVQDAAELATRPGERWRLVSELVTVEARLERLRHRLEMRNRRIQNSETRNQNAEVRKDTSASCLGVLVVEVRCPRVPGFWGSGRTLAYLAFLAVQFRNRKVYCPTDRTGKGRAA